jgi:glycosyltransferase involved in cell wall biosynthesis
MAIEPALVSTIIPVFNRSSMLGEAVASVLGQSYRPIEVIIVDDGSTDGTAGAADALAERHGRPVRVIHQPNGGVGRAREAGRLAARGEFIQHLDSDDLLLPEKFARQVAALRARPECGAAYGWTRFRHDGVVEAVEPRPWKRSGERIEAMFPAMLQSRWWDTPTPLYRRSLIDAAGPWLPLQIEEDWEYDARIASQGVQLAYVEDWMCEVRAHSAGHLSGEGRDPSRLRDRASAHESILGHARRAGIGDDAPEMRHFARELFLLARQCGAAGLADESRRLVAAARSVSAARDLRVYEGIARLVGWAAAGKIATFSDRLRW